MVLEIPVGVTCNNCCVMCTNLMPPPRKWDLSTEQIKEMVFRHPEERKIVLTGGEPTIRKDFFEVLKFIKTEKPDSHLMVLSNGRMFYYEEFAKRFVQSGCDTVAIPLHAQTAELHDSITQAPGSFNQTVEGMKKLIKYGADVEVRVVIHKLNYRQLPAIAEFISKELKGVRRVVLFPIDIIGNANKNRRKLLVKISEVKPYLEKACEMLERNNLEFNLYHVPFCILNKKFWENVAGRTVEERRVTFKPCGKCVMKERCSGIWKTYAFQVGVEEFKPITKSNIYQL